jgi:WD40 repeat protein
MNNGKLIIWDIEYGKNNIHITPVSEFYAHEDAISCLKVNTGLNIIITGSEDGWVYVRNLYDYELLTCIKPPGRDNKIIDIKLNSYELLYILTYDISGPTVLHGYTLNGLHFGTIAGNINNVEFTPSGKLILGYYDNNKICLFDPVTLKVSAIFNFLEILRTTGR